MTKLITALLLIDFLENELNYDYYTFIGLYGQFYYDERVKSFISENGDITYKLDSNNWDGFAVERGNIYGWEKGWLSDSEPPKVVDEFEDASMTLFVSHPYTGLENRVTGFLKDDSCVNK